MVSVMVSAEIYEELIYIIIIGPGRYSAFTDRSHFELAGSARTEFSSVSHLREKYEKVPSAKFWLLDVDVTLNRTK